MVLNNQSQEPIDFPAPWATSWGIDQYGFWQSFAVGEARQVMRWIPPGWFWMGSPEDEPDRLDRETRHKVRLTKGFWLADTTCTQGLWQAVMGENPSRFRLGEDYPVDNVNWDDCQAFIDRLKPRVRGLGFRLPTEAEWEYACRAGSSTAFWWGDELTTDDANYNGNRPYNNGPRGEYREKTMPVLSFEPNPLGLYQMHGNVLEWCEDRYGEYGSQSDTDPTGPDDGHARVLRGGSWIGDGQWLRAASRNFDGPIRRFGSSGFRLAGGI